MEEVTFLSVEVFQPGWTMTMAVEEILASWEDPDGT